MDPLSYECQIPALKYTGPKPLDNPDITFHQNGGKDKPSSGTLSFDTKYINIPLYENHMTLRKAVQSIGDEGKYDDVLYPYNRTDKGKYINRCALKLANIDYHFGLFPENRYDKTKRNDNIDVCDLAGGPGAFSQYILDRFPNGISFGITLKAAIDWSNVLKTNDKFETYYGFDLTGDLIKWYQDYKNEALRRRPNGYDVVVADAGFDENDYSKKEERLYPLLLIQSYLGVALCKEGGHFVVKTYNLVSEASLNIVYMLSSYFGSVSLFKPLLSRDLNVEAYIVCKNRNSYVDNIDLLHTIIQSHIKDKSVGLVYSGIRDDLKTFMKNWNDKFYTRTVSYLTTALRLYRDSNYRDSNTVKANLHKLSVVLKIK